MMMRLAFALAIHIDAEVLLFDEIFAVGDEAFQTEVPDDDARLHCTWAHAHFRVALGTPGRGDVQQGLCPQSREEGV